MASHVNKSSVCDHMLKVRDGKVKCKLCEKEYSYNNSGSTSHLMQHIRAKHPSVLDDRKAQPSLTLFGIGTQRPCSNTRHDKITSLLVNFIVANMLPLSIVESEEFRKLMNYMEPQYKVPCHATIIARLDSKKAQLSTKLAEEMEGSPAVHITTDIWSSIANDAYLGVTVSYLTHDWQLKAWTLVNQEMEERHTQANIAARLGDTARSWSITDKRKVVVHDGASNMKDTGRANNWFDVGRSAHKLRLAITGSLRHY